jgi:hypothetical protein
MIQLGIGCGIEPFREFNVPIFARIDKSIDSFVQK